MAAVPHSQVIQELFDYLVGHIDVKNSHVMDALVSRHIISPEEYEVFLETSLDNKSRVRQLLLLLRKRPPSDFETFLLVLRQHDHGHVADYIKFHCQAADSQIGSMSVRLSCSLAIDMNLQKIIAGIILAHYDKVQLWTLQSDHVNVPMDELYVDLIIVKDKVGIQSRDQTPLTCGQDLFNHPVRRRTIYLSGEPGVGKSTFVQRMCVNWAKLYFDEDKETEPNVTQNLTNYEFVLPIFLRNIRPNQSLCSAIAEEYQLRKREAEALCSYIENTEKHILLIMDGLDEYNEETSTEITELLQRKRWPHVTLFITSRYSSHHIFSDSKRGPDLELLLRGFSESGVKEYIHKFFHMDQAEGDALLHEVKRSEELLHLSHYPAILLMMATLWHSTHKLTNTVTGFYKDFVAFVFARFEKKHMRLADRAKSPDELLRKYHEHVMLLGRLATGNIRTHRLVLNFQYDDVVNVIKDADLKIGFLVEKRLHTGGIFFQFIHKTVQEFFLSYYLVHSPKSIQKELLMQYCGSSEAFTESSVIRSFVAGLGGQELQQQIEALVKGREDQVAFMHTELQLEFLAEHRKATLKLPDVMRLVIYNKYPESHYVKYMRQDGSAVRKMELWSGCGGHLPLLKHLNAPHLTSLHLDRSPCVPDVECIHDTLGQTLSRFPLCQLTVHNLHGDTEVSALIRAAREIPTLKELGFSWIPITCSSAETLRQWLPESNLTSLTLAGCDLKVQQITELVSVCPRSLSSLNVSYNKLSGLADVGGQLGSFRNAPLNSLSVVDCDLTPRDVMALMDVLPELLTELDLGWNCWWKGEGDALEGLAEKLKEIRKLVKLNLSQNKISSAVVMALKQKLRIINPNLQLEIDKQY